METWLRSLSGTAKSIIFNQCFVKLSGFFFLAELNFGGLNRLKSILDTIPRQTRILFFKVCET